MSLLEEQQAFYTQRVPDQFNHTLEQQRKNVEAGEAPDEAKRLEEMEAVRASIAVKVKAQSQGESEGTEHLFEIDRGVMRHLGQSEVPLRPPFMRIEHTLDDFPNLRRECGDSLLGFLGGLAGLGDEMKLTALRVRNLRELEGGLRFERIGPGGFVLNAFFGAAASAEAAATGAEPDPRATIRLSEEVYGLLQSGTLDPQDAFLDGRIEIEGDLEMAIGLALTAASPD
ncbi:MAG: SCP2 sterol-binding domain-containing protein [Myxococcota bacterium]